MTDNLAAARRTWPRRLAERKKHFAEFINGQEDIIAIEHHKLMVYSFQTGPFTAWHFSDALEEHGWVRDDTSNERVYFRPGYSWDDINVHNETSKEVE